jgi:hypothetical protein
MPMAGRRSTPPRASPPSPGPQAGCATRVRTRPGYVPVRADRPPRLSFARPLRGASSTASSLGRSTMSTPRAPQEATKRPPATYSLATARVVSAHSLRAVNLSSRRGARTRTADPWSHSVVLIQPRLIKLKEECCPGETVGMIPSTARLTLPAMVGADATHICAVMGTTRSPANTRS